MGREHGQATIEWAGVVLVAALATGALVAVAPSVDGRSFGAFLAHSVACAVRGRCDDGDASLRAAYGERDAELVRRHAPGLVYEPGSAAMPVDFRSCRSVRCSDGRAGRDLDVHRSFARMRATAFSRVIHRDEELFIQYWLYYPESSTTSPGPLRPPRSLRGLERRLPGLYHRDDWESYQVRIRPSDEVSVRASAHHAYQGCKQSRCRNRWVEATGWTRVSRGSHAGHIPLTSRRPRAHGGRWARAPDDEPLYPGPALRERTTTAAGLRLVPLEKVDRRSYRPLHPGISPPWRKRVYRDPLSDSTL